MADRSAIPLRTVLSAAECRMSGPCWPAAGDAELLGLRLPCGQPLVVVGLDVGLAGQAPGQKALHPVPGRIRQLLERHPIVRSAGGAICGHPARVGVPLRIEQVVTGRRDTGAREPQRRVDVAGERIDGHCDDRTSRS